MKKSIVAGLLIISTMVLSAATVTMNHSRTSNKGNFGVAGSTKDLSMMESKYQAGATANKKDVGTAD
jgi:hypothetical protein